MSKLLWPMRKFIILLITFFGSNYMIHAQISLSEYKHEFGEIIESSKLWFELEVDNKSDKDVRLIRVDNPDNEFEYKFSDMMTLAGGQSRIRVQYNAKEKGKQKIRINFYFDSQTIELLITANVKVVRRDFTPCPDFDQTSSVRMFETEFLILDSDTKKPIPKAIITLSNNQQYRLELESDKNGWVKEVIPLSYYYMMVKADNYHGIDSAFYINSRNNRFEFLLSPVEISSAVELEVEIPPVVEQLDTVIVDAQSLLTDKDPQEDVLVIEDEDSEFSKSDYVANNIVFLMDVSTSMKKENRLEMLKSALLSLTDMMRDDDVITLITYASTTDVLLEGHNMDDKITIKEIIQGIEGKGTTAGGKGIKKAYAIARQYQIPGGNNHIYIATDGAFNKMDDKLVKVISRQADKGFRLSVLSLNSSDFAIKKMTELALAGQGEMIDIKEIENVEVALKALIKKQSKIHK